MTLRLPVFATAAILVAAPAFAQDMPPPPGTPENPVISSQTYPNTGQGSPGIAPPNAVNPAPGATGAYVGAGRHLFYDVDQRIADIQGRLGNLPPSAQRRALSVIRGVKSEEATQRARHGGELRDWDRESINHKLDMLVQQFPSLGAQG